MISGKKIEYNRNRHKKYECLQAIVIVRKGGSAIQFEGIEAFLTICHTKSITKAAKQLYLSQPTVSQRLKALESELGTTLIERKKGFRTLELTAKGEEFVPIAERWMSLWKDTQTLQQSPEKMELSIGCPNSLLTYCLPPVLKALLDSEYPVNIKVLATHAEDMYLALENRVFDICLGSVPIHYENILSDQVFSEKMLLICQPGKFEPGQKVHPRMLREADEIYTFWNAEFQRWHDIWWDPLIKPHVELDTASLILPLMDYTRYWAVVPISIAKELHEQHQIEIHELSEPPPDRITYKMYHRFPKPRREKSIAIFERLLADFAKELPWL